MVPIAGFGHGITQIWNHAEDARRVMCRMAEIVRRYIPVIEKLVFGTGREGSTKVRPLLNIDEQAAVSGLGDLPIELQVKILKDPICDQVAMLHILCMRIADELAAVGGPGRRDRSPVEQMPASQALAVEQEHPTILFFLVGEDIVA